MSSELKKNRRPNSTSDTNFPCIHKTLLFLFTLIFSSGMVQAEESTGSVYRLDEITVSATKMDTKIQRSPTNISVITREDIEKYGAHDITDLLEQVPGFTVWGLGYGSPGIGFYGSRGNEPSMWGVKLMVNGIDWNAGNGSFDPMTVPINDIERIEIIKTPSAVYGDQASGGVINIITRVSDKPFETKAGLGFGSYGAEKYFAVLNGSREKVEYFIDAEHNKTDGYQRPAWEDHTRVYGRLRYLIDDESSLTFHGMKYNVVGNYPYALTLEEFHEDPRQSPEGKGDLDSDHWTSALVYSRSFGSLKADAKMTLIGADTLYFYNRMNLVDELTLWPELSFAWKTRLGNIGSTFNFGVEYRNFKRDLIRQRYNNFTPAAIITDSTRKDDAWGAYFQNELRFTEDFTVTYGIRFDTFDTECVDTVDLSNNYTISDSAWSPKIGASYRFSESFNLFGGINSGFRSFIRGMSASAVTANLKPERVYSYELGMRGTPFEFLKYNIALFQVDTTDKIIRVNEIPDYENAGETRSRGVEAGLDVSLESGLFGSMNYTYQHAKYLEYREGNAVYDGNYITRVPKHLFGLSLGYRHNTLGTVSFYTNYSSEKFLDNANLVEWEDYWIYNAKYSKSFEFQDLSIEFYIDGRNLTDEQYVEYGFGGVANGVQWEALYPSRGRSIMAGLTAHF